MKLLNTKSNEYHNGVIELINEEDWEIIDNQGDFKFNWSKHEHIYNAEEHFTRAWEIEETGYNMRFIYKGDYVYNKLLNIE